jgi:hypothetical protein
MSVLADLVGELSWGLKAAWILWAGWIVLQFVWHRRARVEVPTLEAATAVRFGDRVTLGLAEESDGNRVSARPAPRPGPSRPVVTEVDPLPDASPLPPAAIEAVDGTILAPDEPAPAPAPKRSKRRRQSSRSGTPSPMPA